MTLTVISWKIVFEEEQSIMQSWKSGTIIAALALAMFAGSPLVAEAQQTSGITFDIRTTSHGAVDSTVQTGKGWLSENDLRLDLRGPSLTGPTAGMSGENHSFLIHRDTLRRNVMMLVDHDAKTYMSPEKMIEQMTAMLATLAPEMRPRISLEARNVRVDTLGAGETISGFATRRYRVAMQMVVKVEMLDEKQESTMDMESDALYSEELAEFGILSQWSRSYETMLGPMLGGDSTAANQFRRLEAAFPSGIPLRSEDKITMIEGMPPVRTVTALSNIARASFPQSTFQIPAGYTEQTLPASPLN